MLKRFGIICFVLIHALNAVIASDQNNFQSGSDVSLLRDSVDVYLYESEFLCDSLPQLASIKADRALKIASALNMKEREALASKILGKAKINLEKNYEAEKNLSFALQYYQNTNKEEQKGEILYLLGLAHYHIGNYSGSIEDFLEAEQLFRSLQNEQETANTLESLGLVYNALSNVELASTYYNQSLIINMRLNQKDKVAKLFQNLGIIHYKNKDDSTAFIYLEKSIAYYKEQHDLQGIGISYSNIGLIYIRNSEPKKAYKNFEKSFTYFTKTGFKLGQMWALNNMGTALAMEGNYSDAEDCYFRSLALSEELSSSEGTLANYKDLARYFEYRGLYKTAFSYHEKYTELKDSISLINAKEKLSELEKLYKAESSERIEAELKASSKRQKTRIWAIVSFLSLLILSVLVIVSAYQQKRRAEKKLEDHKKDLEKLVEERTIELEQQISERKTAEESDQLKSAFLANMSHELRTPMNAIIAFSNFLREPELEDDKKNEYLDHITSAGDSLLQLIDDIIDIAKIESKQLKIFIQPTNINRLLLELYKVFCEIRVKNNKKQIRFNLDIDNDYNYIINTDAQRLKQVLTNLIDNAFKYTDKGKIECGFSIEEKSVVFYISDTGIGIPVDKHEMIFNRFYQLKSINDRKISGTGLGLAICKNLVNLLGGQIWVDSQPGMGSTFSIRIPVESIKKQPVPAQYEENRKTSKTLKKGYNWNNITILVAEDEDLNYKVLDTCLTRTNAHIIRAKDGASAIEICKNQRIDIVLMDIQLPGLDGYEATQEIKRINNRTPVIAQTSFAMVGEKERCLQAGCDDFISKPLNIDDLMRKIEHYLVK
ncbi:MAG: tetratricopeptide repeat protein [Bacteroidales bacterium]|nr:tetratricopeptide repeat protein [Bacteroidales bacterium]MBN2818383.1 tetratricopeptide repeat protein [Bacteroidales bacterium]